MNARKKKRFGDPFHDVLQCVEFLKFHLSKNVPSLAYWPKKAVVLGSGLGEAAKFLDEVLFELPYADFTAPWPRCTVEGHEGRLIVGLCGGEPVFVLQGRVHLFEGYSAAEVVLATRVLAFLGVKVIIFTNAAGGIHIHINPGELAIISDHINLTGANPLTGHNNEDYGPRFPDMTEAYSKKLAGRARLQGAQAVGGDLHSGVFAAVPGPNFETPAEVLMLRKLGIDMVGMSTALEVIAARHLGVECLGVSCITNKAAGLSYHQILHKDVVEASRNMVSDLRKFLSAVVPALPIGAEEKKAG